jgi:hypothetical protein
MSTSFGFFSTISAYFIYGKHVGDGSLLTGLPAAGAGVTSTLSTLVFLTSSISTANVTSQQGYISSLTVDYLAIGSNYGYVSLGDVIATSLSSIVIETQTLTTSNLKVGIVSSLSFIAFPGLQQGYAQSVLAEQSTGTGLQELLIFRGSSASDRIRMQTTGSIVFEPGVGARVFPAAPSNATPAMIINASSNVGIGIAAPTVTLDVAGTGRFQILSTQQIFVSTISSGSVFGRFVGDGSLLTGLPAGGLTIIPPILSTTILSTGLLTASNISTITLNSSTINISSVGVNCNSPSYTLDVNGNARVGGMFFNTNAFSWTNGTTHTLYGDSYTDSTKYIQWAYNNTPGTTIADAANMNIACPLVGINCNTPGLALDVAGAGRFTAVSTIVISTNTILANNISTASFAAYEGFFSTFSNELGFSQEAYFSTIFTENLTGQQASISSLTVNSISTNTIFVSSIAASEGFISSLGSILSFSQDANFSTITTENLIGQQAYLSSLIVNSIQIGDTTGFITMGDVLTNSISTNNGFFSTISSGFIYGQFIGDGSLLTGLPAAGAGVTNNLSTLAFYTSSISSTTIQTSNICIGTISSQSFLAYPGLQQGYAQTVIAEQSTGTGLQELLIFRGSSASDRIRMQTTGFICFETGVGARTFPSVGSNATPSWMIDVNGCVGVGLIPSGTQNRLDVAGQGRFQTLSTTSIQAGSMNLSVAFV